MQRLLNRAKKAIADFVEQRDDLILLASCSDNDAPILLKLFRDFEQGNETDVVLIFSDNFAAPGPFVSVLAERLREEHRFACEALVESGKPPFPPIPDIVFDSEQHPSYRLYRAISYTRTLLPAGGGNLLLWVVCPQTIADRSAYLELLSPFIPKNSIQPWMRGLRLVFRDLPDTEQFAPELARSPRLRIVSFDASSSAIQQSFDEEAKDEAVPIDERMQCLLQLALQDSAFGRSGDAIAKLETLLGHYQSMNDNRMQALVLNSIGDVFHRAGNLAQAQHWYECAVPFAGEAKDGVILSTIVKNLAGTAWFNRDYPAAEQYYDGLDQLSAHLLSPEAKIDALLWRGLCQERQNAWANAVGSWEAAATLGRSIGIPALQISALSHLERAYQQIGMRDKLVAVQSELATLRNIGLS